MLWPLNIRNLLSPKEKYLWVQVRILHETDKAILVDNGTRTWIPKSWIRRIRLRKNTFEIYVKESTSWITSGTLLKMFYLDLDDDGFNFWGYSYNN